MKRNKKKYSNLPKKRGGSAMAVPWVQNLTFQHKTSINTTQYDHLSWKQSMLGTKLGREGEKKKKFATHLLGQERTAESGGKDWFSAPKSSQCKLEWGSSKFLLKEFVNWSVEMLGFARKLKKKREEDERCREGQKQISIWSVYAANEAFNLVQLPKIAI